MLFNEDGDLKETGSRTWDLNSQHFKYHLSVAWYLDGTKRVVLREAPILKQKPIEFGDKIIGDNFDTKGGRLIILKKNEEIFTTEQLDTNIVFSDKIF